MMTDQQIIQQPVSILDGIGVQSVNRLQKLNIVSVLDLLFHLPIRYEDRTRVTPIANLNIGQSALICGTIEHSEVLMRGKRSLICQLRDGNGSQLSLRFFHFSAAQQSQLQAGVLLSCFGAIRQGYAGLEIIHPEYKILRNEEDIVTESSLTPIYPLTDGLRQSTIQKSVKQALTLCLEKIPEYLPASIRSRFQFPDIQQTLLTLHAPPTEFSSADLQQSIAVKRLAFEEFIAHHLKMLLGKQRHKQWQAPVFPVNENLKQDFINTLPFQLTAAQQRVIAEIASDCAEPHPMLRLVQGDVGSGKTIVAAITALAALSANYQTAIMAPTELLAEQHFRNFSQWFEPFDINLVFLSGQQKGKTRQAILEAIADGSAAIIIGTHALFQESVHFAKLGLIIIDEQHRFGVHQRLALREKSIDAKPHQLVMTATPIPRTLAMLQYSDLDISIIDELPPGRKPITTCAISNERRQQVVNRINHWVQSKKQAYWVCTLIEESEALQCEAAEKTAELLKAALPEINVALVHGRMKAAEKDQIMQAFKSHQYDLLVATTVIEVGVDVPNAGLMIIENPERLGLSQLHQLRGRVGRGELESYCLLLYQAPLSNTAAHRLGIMRDTQDGFLIAEKDLQLRGPGEIMGTRQTGQIGFKIADLEQHADLLEQVEIAAQQILQEQPESAELIISRWLGGVHQYAEV